MLLKIYNNPRIIKQDAIEFNEGSGRAKYNTLVKLIKAGLIKEDETTYQYNIKHLYCTEKGEKICNKLEEIKEILPKLECSSSEYTSNANLW